MQGLNLGTFLSPKLGKKSKEKEVQTFIDLRLAEITKGYYRDDNSDFTSFSYDELTAGIVHAVLQEYMSKGITSKVLGISPGFETLTWEIIEGMEQQRYQNLSRNLGLPPQQINSPKRRKND